MLRTLCSLLATAALAYLLLCALMYFTQRSMIYFPQPRALVGAAPLLTLQVNGASIQVTTRMHVGPDAVIYFGGNAEDVSQMLPDLAVAFPERALYLLHYRGYGGSTGTPAEQALHADALALFDRVHAEHPNVTVIGRSLGSALAVPLAAQRPVARLVLITPFDSLESIAAHHYPWVPVRWLLRDKFASWRLAPQVTAPTLLLVAEQDEIIPRVRSEALYAGFPKGVASLRVLAGTSHNTIGESAEYLPLLMGR